MNKKALKYIGIGLLAILSSLLIFSFINYKAIFLPIGWTNSDSNRPIIFINSFESSKVLKQSGFPFLEKYSFVTKTDTCYFDCMGTYIDTNMDNSIASFFNSFYIFFILVVLIVVILYLFRRKRKMEKNE